MTVNRDMMERYCSELETTTIPQEIGSLFNSRDGTACALGIGVLMLNPNLMQGDPGSIFADLNDFIDQLGTPTNLATCDIPLDDGQTVTEANDDLKQPFFTIAQRLRAKYLKEEGS